MSAPPSIDAYDAQMLDFSSDPDIPMNITGSAEFFAEALMDHDDHLVASTYAEHASVEVDMEEYVGDNAEYEMADETSEYQRPHGDELLDIEVYDASHAPSPLAPPQPLQSPVNVLIGSEHPTPTSPVCSEHAALPEVQDEPESEVDLAPLGHLPADVPQDPSVSREAGSSEAVASDSERQTDALNESIPPASESHEQLGDTARSTGQLSETPATVGADDEAEFHIPPAPVAEENPTASEVARESSEPPTVESAPLASAENTYNSGPPVLDEKAAEQVPLTEGGTVDPLHISDGVYIDPPPAVLLSIADPSDPGFVLFNQPDIEGEFTEQFGNQKVYSLLLESWPTLYYEPLSNVFEVLRQDEDLLSRIPNSFEGELVLDAHDLQLAVSEDNVHSREISLHDLNILHDGSDFVGPLRLFLRAVAPRFIIRYCALQERIQRLNVAAETGEGEQDDERHPRYDVSEEQHQPQQEEAASHPSSPAAAVSEGLEAPPTTEVETPIKEPVLPPEPTEEAPQENYELEDTSVVQEVTGGYHEVSGEATHALEDEDDYEDTNAEDEDEDESAKSDRPDTDLAHDAAAEDTDAPATVTGQRSEFGGEQTEYSDCVQPEDYDERYGEDLPERAGGASPVQYGGPSYHEEEGEQDASTAVGEAQAILSGSDEDEEDKSAATPIPDRVDLEPELREPADNDAVNELISSKQEMSGLQSSKELTTSKSTNEVVYALQVLGNPDTSSAQAKIFSEVDESDSNFVSVLKREADAEFDQTSNPEQGGQDGSIAVTLQHDETWDEWDDEDAEGEDDEDWMDPDAASNESSVTLSSKASSKRSYDEVDPSREVYVEDPRNSPGPKRPRVQ